MSVFLSSRAELSRTSRGSSSATLLRKDNCGQLYVMQKSHHRCHAKVKCLARTKSHLLHFHVSTSR